MELKYEDVKKFLKMNGGIFGKINVFRTPVSPLNPVDTGRKLNVCKTFRRRPGRLRNVLCTFNLRPVSTGKFHTYILHSF